jgi:lipoprotein-releasing system ATP-binding protein
MTNSTADAPSFTPPWIAPRRAAHHSAPIPAPQTDPTSMLASSRPGTHLGCRGLFKSYSKGEFGIPVLQGIDLDVRQGEFLAIVGQSGSGKSTLLHLLATLDRPDAGAITFEGHRIDNTPASARDLLRNKYFGMVFQFYHLLPELSALQNILAPAMIAESTLGYLRRRSSYRRRAFELLDVVGLSQRAKHKPRELSGGEMQRAAIARALLMRPKVLMADEPTGNLDRSTGEQIMRMLKDLNRRENLTIVMVTHDPWIASQADRTVQLVEGKIA